MANAKKCNRCERCFDPLKVEGMMGRFVNPIFQTSEDIRNNKVGARLIDAEPDAYIDLCPECAKMFEAFMCHGDIPTYIPGQDTDGDAYEVFRNCVVRYTSGEKEIKRLQAELDEEKRKHEKAGEKMFEALARAREAEEEVKRQKKTMDRWEEQMQKKQIECNDYREQLEALQRDYVQLKYVHEWNNDLGEEIKILRKENEELHVRAEKYEESIELLKKQRDEAHEDLAGMAEENDWLYEMLNVEKTHDIWPLIGKLKAEVLDALQEWNAEEIKKKFIDGMERLFYGETPKVEKNKCAGCRGSEGECPFHVKPMCDKTKGANE